LNSDLQIEQLQTMACSLWFHFGAMKERQGEFRKQSKEKNGLFAVLLLP
jgi:hypothetical protein